MVQDVQEVVAGVKVLDLFCGAGGAAIGLSRAWPDAAITGVDVKPMPNYPFRFIQADAMTFPLDGYDFIWASPPCQGFSTMKALWRDRDHPLLIEPIRERLKGSGADYIIENVEGAAKHLIAPVMICGTMFDPPMDLRRHRYFETSFDVQPPQWPCRHSLLGPRFAIRSHGKVRQMTVPAMYGHGDKVSNAAGPGAMGIDWMTRAEIVEAIPPMYSEFLARQWQRARA